MAFSKKNFVDNQTVIDADTLNAIQDELIRVAGLLGKDIQSAAINDSGHLILTLTDGTPLDAGIAKGATGPAGPQGPAGAPGKDGSDATVTAENIAGALGYTPAAPSDIPVVPAAEIRANTAARHSHKNKAVIDGITGQVTADKVNALTTPQIWYSMAHFRSRRSKSLSRSQPCPRR